jgi:hypothetical protein
VQSSSLIELAEENRPNIASDESAVTGFKRERQWFMEYDRFHDGSPNAEYLTDQSAALVTNWASYQYDDIRFDNSSVQELLIDTSYAYGGLCGVGCFVIVTFRIDDDGKKTIIAIVNTTYATFLDSIKSLSDEYDGLFTCV